MHGLQWPIPDPVCGGPSRTGYRGQCLTQCVMGLISQATVACIWPSLTDLAAQATVNNNVHLSCAHQRPERLHDT